MLLENLVGRQLSLSVSDPWDFCSQHGTGPFSAAIESVSGDELLLRLTNVVTFKGVEFDRVVATARHLDKPLDLIVNRDSVPANLTPLPFVSGADQGGDAFHRAARWRECHLIATVLIS